MSEEGEKRPIIIRRIKKIRKGAHHGGSWKIAYADFVTAMMAFFLLMWLLGLMNRYELEGIAEYFKKPLKEAFQHEGNQRNRDKERDKNKFKEINKEKPMLIDSKQNTNSVNKSLDAAAQKIKPISPEELKKQMEKDLESNPKMVPYKNQLNFVVTADGLKIQLHDLDNKPMFSTGRADFEAYSKIILDWIGDEINKYPNNVMIIGHTDAAPYQGGGGYTNWELSADRANATRRVLVKYGMEPEKILRVVGVSDKFPLNKENNLDAVNRRIEIIVLTDQAAKKLVNQY